MLQLVRTVVAMFVSVAVGPHVPGDAKKLKNELGCPSARRVFGVVGLHVFRLILLPGYGDVSLEEWVPSEEVLLECRMRDGSGWKVLVISPGVKVVNNSAMNRWLSTVVGEECV